MVWFALEEHRALPSLSGLKGLQRKVDLVPSGLSQHWDLIGGLAHFVQLRQRC